MSRGKQFRKAESNSVRRTPMDLSHSRRLTCDMFKAYPIMVEDCIPGDVWKINHELVVRMNPMVAPMMHPIRAYIHDWFVPYRILWKDFQRWYTGGQDGNYGFDVATGKFTVKPPRSGTNQDHSQNAFIDNRTLNTLFYNDNLGKGHYGHPFFVDGGIMDHLYGFSSQSVPGFTNEYQPFSPDAQYTFSQAPLSFPYRAYRLIWYENYRDRNLFPDYNVENNLDLELTEFYRIPATPFFPIGHRYDYDGLFARCWSKDYFTSSLPWQQRGIAPAIPLSGKLGLKWDSNAPEGINLNPIGVIGQLRGSPSSDLSLVASSASQNGTGPLYVDVGQAITFDTADLRLQIATQNWLERNARAGSRFVEMLRARFPAWPRDDRLQRPEYIGGSVQPIVISEVLQTSRSPVTDALPGQGQESFSPQGTMAGHGISAARNRLGNYRVQEPGCIISLLSFMPDTMYQQGMNRVWNRNSRLEMYQPEFRHLSEQAIELPEIFNYFSSSYIGENATPQPIFGYQGRYDEYRYRASSVHGQFRRILSYWSMQRIFNSRPYLNTSFISPSLEERYSLKRILAVRTEPMFLCSVGNRCVAVRPMPFQAIPGFMDHR